MVLIGGIAFGAIAFNLQNNGPIIQADVPVSNAVHQMALQSSPLIKNVMISGFYIGEQVIVVIGGLLFLYFIFYRQWPELCMIVIAWAGEGALWIVLSQAYNRPRPEFAVPVWHQMTSPGFPSGHSISAVMCYGLLAYLLMPAIRASFWKVVVIVAAILIILFVGTSRIFVGDHYLSDVLAGYALGIAWCGFVYTLVELIFKKRVIQNVQKK